MWGNGCGNTFGLHGWAIFFADLFATIGARQDALHFMFCAPKKRTELHRREGRENQNPEDECNGCRDGSGVVIGRAYGTCWYACAYNYKQTHRHR